VTSPHSPIAEWLARVTSKGAARVELWTWRGDHPERQVSVWKSVGKEFEKLGDEMQADAENHGRSQNGQRVTYALLAYDGTGDKVAEFFVKVAGGNAKESGGMGDVSDLGGVVAHLVKGNNDLAGIIIRAFQGRDDTLVRQIELLSTRLDSAEKRNAESLLAQQKFILMASEQKRLDAQLAQEQQRHEWLHETASLFLPMILNRALGGGKGKGAPAGDAIFAAISQTLTSEECEALANALQAAPIPEMKKIGFLEILQGAMRRQQRMLNADPTPDANGAASNEPTS
jgi:hypothetical protein